MSLRATINVHYENHPVSAEVREVGGLCVALCLGDPGDYGDLTLFFSAKQKDRAEKIAALINEMAAPEPAPVESEDV